MIGICVLILLLGLVAHQLRNSRGALSIANSILRREPRASQCPAGCSHAIPRLALSVLGISSPYAEESQDEFVRPAELLRSLCANNSKANDNTISEVRPESLFDRNSDSPEAAVLVDGNSHIFVLLHPVRLIGEEVWRLVHGDGSPEPSSLEQLRAHRFVHAWIRRTSSSKGQLIQAGTASLRVNRLWFDLTDAQEAAFFTLTNMGPEALVVESSGASCQCVAPKLEKDSRIEPGSTLNVPMQISSTQVGDIRESVWINLLSPSCDLRIPLQIDVLSSRVAIFVAHPTFVDFGDVRIGEVIKKSLRLEARTSAAGTLLDHSDISCTGLDVSCERIDLRSESDKPSQNYQLEFRAGDIGTGTHQGEFVVSDGMPIFSVPVQVNIRPRTKLNPESVNFGVVFLGEHATRQMSVDAGAFTIRRVELVDNAPGILLIDGDSPTSFQIEAVFSNPGQNYSQISIAIEGDTWTEVRQIPVAAFARREVKSDGSIAQ